jgi:hypothetical protein
MFGYVFLSLACLNPLQNMCLNLEVCLRDKRVSETSVIANRPYTGPYLSNISIDSEALRFSLIQSRAA